VSQFDDVKARMSRVKDSYERGEDSAGEDRPLRGYAALLGLYGGLTAAAVAVVRRKGLPTERPDVVDIALLAASTFRVSRTLAKDAVTSPLRAPFATYQGPGGPGEVMEAPRPGPFRHAAGELLTCPFCLTQWVASAGVVGFALFPQATRWVTAGMTAVAAADALHYGYAKLQETAG
jgi:Protein of unknown function (DUF1360)